MVIKSQQFKNVCTTILAAIDSNVLSTLTETLELKTEGKNLNLSVTNGEYFVSVDFPLDSEENLHASVNANLFLKLVSSITTEDIALTMKNGYLEVKANGSYKIPYVYEDGDMLTLPRITIANPTVEMKISGDILQSILDFNSKELLRGTVSRPVQRMYYIDEKGCLTFTTGACVNYFELEKPIKVLFNGRLVKLFKLFKNRMVDFTLGYDSVDENLVQTKVEFSVDNITLTAITGCNDELLQTVPVNSIRGRAEADYEYNIVLNTEEFKDAVDRLLLFSAGYGSIKNLKPYSTFTFSGDRVIITDSNRENSETITFKNDTSVSEDYEMTLDLQDLKLVLDTISEEYINIGFGNHQAVVFKRGHITNVVPECTPIS